MIYELEYKLNDSTEWAFHSDYKTKDKAQDALIYFSDFALGWRIVEKPTTELEKLERRIKAVDLLLLSLWVIAIFGITYLLISFL